MNNQTNDTLYIVCKRPPVDWVSSPMELTFHNEYNFNKWFNEEASCHATWNKKKSATSSAAPSTSYTKDTPGPRKKIDWSLLYVCDHSHKLSSIPPATKKRRTNLLKHTGCTSKIKATKRAVDGIIEDIKEPRLPFDVKNWTEKHVEERKDWGRMKDLLQLSNESENEINVDPNVLKIPAALRVHPHDIVNQIQQRNVIS
ncbi:hypothetical protein INT45_002222 [Circinella minor]|uniref:Uncharacterized protein n=1 Tax=Circinella minor TaxID=1195481 RepID=A0A8H7SDZ5_9FUNG|nr:hypothetical protein INT45_002222 [Circinella minor]